MRELARPLILGPTLYSVPLPNQTLFSRLLFYWFVYGAFFLHVHLFPPVSAICSSRRRYLWWMQPNNVHKRKMLLIEFWSLSVLFILPYKRPFVVVHFLSTKPIRRKFDELPNYVPHCIIEIFKRVPVVFGSISREKWDNNNKDRVSERERAREKTYKISFTV